MWFKGFRTLAFNLLIAIGGVIITFDWGSVLPAEYVGPATIVIGIIGLVLRTFTNTPVTKQNAVSAVAAMPDDDLRRAGVVKMLVANNITGEALANLTPGNVVVPADQASFVGKRHA